MTQIEIFEAGYSLGKLMQITTNIEWFGMGIIFCFFVQVVWYLVKHTIIYERMNDDL